jgi:hypothetical protein
MDHRMSTNFYAIRHWLLALRVAAGVELEAELELLVSWPPGPGIDTA